MLAVPGLDLAKAAEFAVSFEKKAFMEKASKVNDIEFSVGCASI